MTRHFGLGHHKPRRTPRGILPDFVALAAALLALAGLFFFALGML
jgi:hypothetical protein